MVISTIGMPPLVTVSAAKWASSAEETRMAGMIPISRMRSHTSAFFILGVLSIPTRAILPTAGRSLDGILHRPLGIWCRKLIALAGKPGVKSRQEENANQQVGHEPSNNYDCKGALRIRTNSVRERGGKQTQSCHQHGHHDRPKPQNRSFDRRLFDRVASRAKLIDVFHHDHAGLHRHAKEREKSDAR